jgi:multidrug resistance efflux pump
VKDNQHRKGHGAVGSMRGITRRKCSRPQRKIAQTNAGIANSEAQIAAQEAAIKQADKQVAEADAALKFSNQENDRCQDLVSTGAVQHSARNKHRPTCSRSSPP